MKPRKLPSGNWTVRVQIGGVRKSFTAPTRKEVLLLAQSYKINAKSPQSAPLGDLIDQYIQIKENVLSPSTISHYRQYRRLYFGRLMSVPANEITEERLQAEVNLLAADHSPKTVRNAYGLISAALALFVGANLRITLPRNKRPDAYVPTTEEVFLLIENAGTNLKTAIMLAAFCGLRRGEIVALKKSDIVGDQIHVQRAVVVDSDGCQVEKDPKTYTSDRYVKPPAFVRAHLDDQGDNLCPIALNSVTRRFTELRDKLGVECRFHDLRHYYASSLHAAGVKDQYIMRFGGWRSDSVLKSVYRGTMDDFESKSADISTDFFEKMETKWQRKAN